jgi:hypothetical protein
LETLGHSGVNNYSDNGLEHGSHYTTIHEGDDDGDAKSKHSNIGTLYTISIAITDQH